jgi:Rrf2 family protein
MQLTRATEYAIRGLAHLCNGPEQSGRVHSMAGRLKMPESFLAKIFASMAKAGIVISRRGQHGGYRLAKKPAGISLKKIIEAVEGPFALTRCLRPTPSCDIKRCGVKKFFSLAQRRMEEVLNGVTLADVATELKTKKTGTRRKKK